MQTLAQIRVVLVEPTHPGNIGAVARAMANMGVSELALVRPHEFPSAKATARAVSATAQLENAIVADDLDHAIGDCSLIIGASARLRAIQWPQLLPQEAMRKAAAHAQQSRVALLFGRESRGLTNAELERCHYLVRIPVDENCPSLNLAAAVMVLLYELRGAAQAFETDPAAQIQPPDERPASAEEMRYFYAHLRQLLDALDFADGNADKLHRKLTRLFNRAQPYARETRILRGVFNTVEEKLRGKFDK